MNIRPARTIDVFRLAELLTEQCAASKYAGIAIVDEAVARRTLAQFIQRHGGTHDGATCVFVAETGEGVISGFVAGALDRIYHVGDQLAANDVYLVASPDAPATTARRLLNAYLEWADSVPDVAEVRLSWTDALPTGERMGAIYQRMGFRKCGEIYERAPVRAGEERSAA